MKIYDAIGGKEKIRKIANHFYTLVFNDSTLKHFFIEVDQEHQEKQFVDFMSGLLGGPRIFCGRMPKEAHPHLFIKSKHFDLRAKLLHETLQIYIKDKDLVEKWLKIDESFRSVVTKSSLKECEKRFATDKIISA